MPLLVVVALKFKADFDLDVLVEAVSADAEGLS